MSQELEKSVYEAIQQHLPAATAGVLRQALEKAEKDAKEVKNYKERVELLNTEITSMTAALLKFGSLEAKEVDVKQQEAALERQKRDQSVFELTVKLEAAKASTEKIFELVRTIFKAPVVTKTLFGTEHTGVPGGGQYAGYVSHDALQKTEITQVD